jgi:tetratricopeptide (TPR) repeat protein
MLEAAARSPELLLIAFDDRAQLFLDRGELESRPGLEPLLHLRPHDLSLVWFEELGPDERAKALTSAAAAATLAGDHALPWAVLGSIQRRTGDLEGAARSYERAIANDRDQATYFNNHGAILLDLHRLDAAEASFLTAARLAPDRIEGWLNLGRVRLLTGDTVGARTALLKARRAAPLRGEVHFLLGLAETDADRSRAHLERCLEVEPDGPWAADARDRLMSR